MTRLQLRKKWDSVIKLTMLQKFMSFKMFPETGWNLLG